MSFWTRWYRRKNEDLDDEIAAHLAMAASDREARGEPAQQARRNARRELGNEALVKEVTRNVWRWAWLDRSAQDVKFALRQMRRTPGFTAVALLTLALGVGANTAIFSLVNTVLLNALPFAEPDRLVFLFEDFTERGGPADVQPSPAAFASWTRQNQELDEPAFEQIAAIQGFSDFNLLGRGEPERFTGAEVSGNLFGLLRLRAVAGRTLLPEDDAPGADPVVVLSEGLWRRRFDADPGLIGQMLDLNGIKRTVVGVVPGDFQYPTSDIEFWTPIALTPETLKERMNFYLEVVARLNPRVSLKHAQSAMDAFSVTLQREYPAIGEKIGGTVVALHERYARVVRPALTLLLATVGMVLLIACTNVAQLLLARGTHRRQEMALRGALGAERRRLLWQSLTESLVLGALGTAAGTGIAVSTFWFLARLIPENFPPGTAISLDWRVLLFTLSVAVVTAVGFGIGPALASSRLDLNEALKQGAGRSSTHSKHKMRGLMVAAEVALTVVLLIAAGLLLRSYAALRSVDPGFTSRNLLIAETVVSPAKYSQSPRRLDFYRRTLTRVRALPGVRSAAYVNLAPLVFKGGRIGFSIEGRPDPVPGETLQQMAIDRVISQDYLETMGIPLVRGRSFEERDSADAPLVVVINQSMASTFWPDEDSIGHRIRMGGPDAPWYTIIGVTGDVREINLDKASEPELFLAMTQPFRNYPFFWPRQLVVRTEGNPLSIATDIRQAVWSADPEQSVSNIRTMGQVVEGEFVTRNTQLILIASFAVLALVLASVGLYGVLSYTVAQRTPELGLRMALGAQRPAVIGMVLRRMLLWTGAGLLVGLVTALALGRLVESFLYGVSATDPAAFAGAAGLMMAVAAVASWLPARRAASVDPAVSLRSE